MKKFNSQKRINLFKEFKNLPGKRIFKNTKEIEKRKDGRNLSRRGKRKFSLDNGAHNYWKYSHQNYITNLNRVNKTNDFDDVEELDHPKPLKSDIEENLEGLKNQFIKKANKKIKKVQI